MFCNFVLLSSFVMLLIYFNKIISSTRFGTRMSNVVESADENLTNQNEESSDDEFYEEVVLSYN